MKITEKLFLLILLIPFFSFSSCENPTQAQQDYYKATQGSRPAVQKSMDKLFAKGTNLPTGEAFTKEVNTIGDCKACMAAREAEKGNSGGSSYTGSECAHYKDFLAAGVNKKALKQALFFYKQNKRRFTKQRYISIADYSKNSRDKRFYILDMQTGRVQKENVSHGSGSSKYGNPGDPNHDGMLDRCHRSGKSTNPNSRYAMTRGGFFETENFYHSSHNEKGWPVVAGSNYNGLKLKGLSSGVNNEAESSGVVMHGAWYNTGAVMGRSFGCPAFRPDRAKAVLDKIYGGSLYYSYVPQCQTEQGIVDNEVRGWEGMCRG